MLAGVRTQVVCFSDTCAGDYIDPLKFERN